VVLHSTLAAAMMPGTMTEQRRDSDEPRLVTDETREALPIPEAAERLGLSIDAVRMRIRRGTLQTADLDGKKHVLVPRLDTDATRRDDDATPTEPPHDGVEMLDQLRSEIAYLRRTLDAEIEARRRADHLVAGMIDERRDLMRRLEAGTEHRRVTDETPTVEDASQERAVATERDDQPVRASEALIDRLRRLIGR
jgi:hypothetical protein